MVIFSFLCVTQIASSQDVVDIVNMALKSPASQYDSSLSFHFHQAKDFNLNVGVGFLTTQSFALDLIGGSSGQGKPSPALNLQAEYGVNKQLSLAAFFSYYRVDAEQELSADLLEDIIDDPICAAKCALGIDTEGCFCDGGTVKERNNVYTIGGKIAYHRRWIENVDTYISGYLGYSINKRKTLTESVLDQVLDQTVQTEIPEFVYYVNFGIRYYFTPNIGIYGEGGYSNVHLLQLGASYRF